MELVESAESACNARDDKGGFLVAGETLYLKQKVIKRNPSGAGEMIEYR